MLQRDFSETTYPIESRFCEYISLVAIFLVREPFGYTYYIP